MCNLQFISVPRLLTESKLGRDLGEVSEEEMEVQSVGRREETEAIIKQSQVNDAKRIYPGDQVGSAPTRGSLH